jgi:hypothetical protein
MERARADAQAAVLANAAGTVPHNRPLQPTVESALRFLSIPSSLRSSAAAERHRWATESNSRTQPVGAIGSGRRIVATYVLFVALIRRRHVVDCRSP